MGLRFEHPTLDTDTYEIYVDTTVFTMSIPGLGTSHLQQTKLSNEAVDLLKPLADWLSTLEFARHPPEFENLVHSQLREKMNPLLTELGLLNKVKSIQCILNIASDS